MYITIHVYCQLADQSIVAAPDRKWHGGGVSESQKVTKQPALTTASGGIWLVVGGIIAIICLVLLWLMRDLEPLGAAITGIVIIVVAYLAMLAIRYGVRAPRLRLWSLAVLTIGIAVTFMTVAIITVYGA
jgi:hypothetical protein